MTPAKNESSAQWRSHLHWVLPLMLALVAVTVLLSGRDLSQNFADLARGGTPLHPAVPWIQRVVSLLLVFISLEMLWRHFSARERPPIPALAWAFCSYWAATVAAPALFGAHRSLSHEYLYPLIIGLAALLATEADRHRMVAAVRTALFFFLLAGVAMAAVQPALVLDMTYSQGLLPGVPRFGGLAAHPVALGIFAQTFLLCLWVRPFERKWHNVFAWPLGLGVLFFAQSKTAWIGFLVCATAMLVVRQVPRVWRRATDPREPEYGIVTCLGAIAAIGACVAGLLLVDLGAESSSFFATPEGAQLMTLTGRDQIWAIALEEWRASPVFGYGPTLWDDDFRASIGMPNATNAHNQFMDTLARSGVVGATALVLYAVVLLALSLRAARATGGLSIALFIALALRSVSEVPLSLFGYGSEFFAHLLLITLLPAANARRAPAADAARRRTPLRTAT
jgi:O-antigen ligase